MLYARYTILIDCTKFENMLFIMKENAQNAKFIYRVMRIICHVARDLSQSFYRAIRIFIEVLRHTQGFIVLTIVKKKARIQ